MNSGETSPEVEQNENSIWSNKVNRNNLIIVSYLWSSSGFISYLLMYYSKYFKGDFFINYGL